MRIRWKLPLAFALTTLLFAGVVALVAALVLRGAFLDRLEDDMSRMAHMYAAVLQTTARAEQPNAAGDELQEMTRRAGAAGEIRLTVIAHDGRVLADSEADPSTLKNHADRPEVAQALRGNEGRERRYSTTLGQQEVYVAIPLPTSDATWSDGVVRTARPASRVDAMVAASWRIPVIVWAALLLPTLVVTYLLTRSITVPLERLTHMTARVASGELAYRTSVRTSDELGDLAGSLNSMAAQLEARAGQLEAEIERSKLVLTAMSEGVLLVDADGSLLRSNPAAEKILGVKLEGAEGQPLVLAARSFPAQAYAKKAHESGRAITEVLELLGGRSLTVEVVPLWQSTGNRGGQTLFVIRDETARRVTERMRRDFATNVSHELKTPLAGVSLLVETLTNAIREDPQEAERFVARLSAEIGRLTEITNDLLTLSRLEEPGAALGTGFASVDLARLATEVSDEVRSLADAKGHQMTVDAPAGIVVMGDEVALRTLVRNLLENAIRYTEPGGRIVLTAQSEADRDGKEWAVLRVVDNGVGIPLADQQRIFERFYRVDKARSRETGGTGLGLSIVRHVAETHGGRVEVQSTVGVGSTFTVRIPKV